MVVKEFIWDVLTMQGSTSRCNTMLGTTIEPNTLVSKTVMNQLAHFLKGILTNKFFGMLTDIHRESYHSRNRRTLSHFLTYGKWDEKHLDVRGAKKDQKPIFQEAKHIQEPMFGSVYVLPLGKKTKPWSQAMFSM